MSIHLATLAIRLAEQEGAEPEVNHLLSYGIGGLVFAIMLALLLGLLAFGGGRDHT